MSDTITVFSALPALGFVNPSALGLMFRHPRCELSAVEAWIPYPVVSFAGHYNHGREMGYLEFQLPTTVESLDQLKAFLAYYLRNAMTVMPPSWFAEGQALSHLLPWERERAAYAARDHCIVRREWLRLALKDLADASKNLQPSELVTFAFDGSLLSIFCGHPLIVQAQGSAWRDAHRIKAGDLTSPPKRLMHDSIEVGAWKDHLLIGNRRYPLATGIDDGGAADLKL